MNRPLVSDARYRSIASDPATDGFFGSKYNTDGKVGRGPCAVGNWARWGEPAESTKATALFVVPKSTPTQEVGVCTIRPLNHERQRVRLTPAAAPPSHRSRSHDAPATSSRSRRPT